MVPDEQRSWLGLRMVRGVGPVIYRGLLQAFGEPAAVFAASRRALEAAGARPEVAGAIRAFDDWGPVDQQLERLKRSGAGLVTWNAPAYPPNLREIHDPPPFLFAHGAVLPRDMLAVAVVGSRYVSAYGLRMARELTEGLVRHGLTVVSGMARGTDAQVHWTALRAGGRTFAVIGSGIDVVYPSEHKALFHKISTQGAVVTELLMGTQPDAENFPSRNRIISGLALGTVVIEAAEKSGSLITARLAADQGREVFAVPGNVGTQTSKGTNRLIKAGATLVESADDLIEQLAGQLGRAVQPPVPPPPLPREMTADEQRVFDLLSWEPAHVDELTVRLSVAPERVSELLLELELKGLAKRVPGQCYVRQVTP